RYGTGRGVGQLHTDPAGHEAKSDARAQQPGANDLDRSPGGGGGVEWCRHGLSRSLYNRHRLSVSVDSVDQTCPLPPTPVPAVGLKSDTSHEFAEFAAADLPCAAGGEVSQPNGAKSGAHQPGNGMADLRQ